MKRPDLASSCTASFMPPTESTVDKAAVAGRDVVVRAREEGRTSDALPSLHPLGYQRTEKQQQ